MQTPASRIVSLSMGIMAVAAAWTLSCREVTPDVDDQQPKALRISPGVLVKDSLDPARGDAIDWKDFSYYTDVGVSVVFAFGEMYRPHGLRGEITLFSFDGNVIQRHPVVPEKRDYPFQFTARQDKDYFFKVEAYKGESGYMVETKVTPLDVCAACPQGTTCCRPTGQCCSPGTECRDGTCVRSAVRCTPSCRKGRVCVAGTCEKACPGGCPRGKRCDVKKRRCVPRIGGPPPPPPPPPPKCKSPCEQGQTCNRKTGQCEGGNVIVGSVLSAVEKGALTEILINLGSQDGVKRKARGTVGRFSFTVSTVSATRCRAKIKAPPDQVRGKKVRINR